MSEKVGREQAASKKKMRDAARKKTLPDSPSSPRFRKSPGGKRLAALRKKKMDGE